MYLLIFSIGILVLLPGTFYFFVRCLNQAALPLLRNVNLSEEKPSAFVPRLAVLNFLEPYWVKRTLEAAILMRFEIGRLRPIHFFIASAPLGIFLTLAVSILFLNVNSLVLLPVSLLAYLLSFRWPYLWQIAKLIFAYCIVAFVFEFAVRNMAGLQNMLTDSEIIWILADGRWLSCLFLFGLSSLVGVALRIPYFGFWTGIILYFTQILSLNGFIFIFAGEIFASIILIFWKVKDLRGTVSQFWRQWLAVALVGLALGIIFCAGLRFTGFGELQSFDQSFTEKWFEAVQVMAAMIFGMLIALGAWGHFSYKNFISDFRSEGVIHFSASDRLVFPSLWAWWKDVLAPQLGIWEKADSDLSELDVQKVPQFLQHRVRTGLKDLKFQRENLRSFLQD